MPSASTMIPTAPSSLAMSKIVRRIADRVGIMENDENVADVQSPR